MNVFKNKNVGKIKKTLINVKKRAPKKRKKTFFTSMMCYVTVTSLTALVVVES